ncbi:MAG TPA: S8 family serine peptidase [Jatrophihabitantaceae bacterium]
MIALTAGLATAAGTLVPVTSSVAAPVPSAPVVGAAQDGGAVIVWLKDQHADLNLRTQSRQRIDAAHEDQNSLVADIRAHGGTDLKQLVSVNAVAANLSADEVQRLRTDPAVKQIVPDSEVTVGEAPLTGSATSATTAPASGRSPNCDTKQPQIEPEALTDIHAYSNDPRTPDMANSIATGKGVVVANDGIDGLAGNPNFTRPDGSHVVIGASDYTADDTDEEYYGDASSIAAQGTVVYDYAQELPYSGLAVGRCTFVLRGDAPDASLVDINHNDHPESSSGDVLTESESQIVAGIDAAVTVYHADVLSESYGYGLRPGNYATHYAANDAAVAAGVTVVVSSGDSGVQGTVSSPASDPLVIEVGATNTLRLEAQAYGYDSWANDDITPLSSGGTTPNNKVPDLVAPGYSGQAACNPAASSCPSNTHTVAFGGTSQSCPLVSGAVADVIQAYRDSHNGASPAPALIKQILISTATDTGAPADQQGAGLLNIDAAVKAARQLPGSTVRSSHRDAPSLIASTPSADTSQLEVVGDGGPTVDQTVNLYNTSAQPTLVTATSRAFTEPKQFGATVTENLSAPDPAKPVPAKGADAAKGIDFIVPSGLARMTPEMIWPDPTNGNVLSFILTDPRGRLRQQSYDYGTASTNPARPGTVPNSQRVEIAHPEPGRWHAEIVWANGRAHLQEPPNVPGGYTGTVQFRTVGQHYQTAPASYPVIIPGHSTRAVSVPIAMPRDPGDHPESVQFLATNGATTSLPVARRTPIPAVGGSFQADIVGTVGRGTGQISTFVFPVSAGRGDLTVNLHTADTSPDNGFTAYLVRPSDGLLQTSAAFVNGNATLTVANPGPGLWEIDIKLNLTTSGQEFHQIVNGEVVPAST